MPGKRDSRRQRRALRSDRTDCMVTVVDFMPRHQADEAFEVWLDEAGFSRGAIRPRGRAVDDEPGVRGGLRRYRVHYDLVPKR